MLNSAVIKKKNTPKKRKLKYGINVSVILIYHHPDLIVKIRMRVSNLSNVVLNV